ncbi:activator of HSP90 ATPase [Knoellia sinensis KCTC 19936]|uniref:Activator of HSP90 ATPase n=1 Tax=Knoellia sinensis KCTC 19936 TaxID=1385520 RepID=A0A0A0IZF1_9MICO|nr:SRPBCC family protein [Knoellia sinensis]KGN30520.1 activator of HSP90 ATPase [Knoellia sinensis KCTC 19936]
MEFGTLERQVHVEASPEVVFEVVSRPEHIREWWSDDASLDAVAPGAVGELVWRDGVDSQVESFTVVDVDPPRRFSFRWVTSEGETAKEGNSLLVTFDLEPSATGTTLRLTETGFREKGWEVAVLEEAYRDHERGWDLFLPRLVAHAATVAA